MNQEQVWQQFATLPPIAQQEVMDFMAFLRQRYAEAEGSGVSAEFTPPLRDEPFIGVWKDREAMRESSVWVRDLRNREWD